MTFFAASQAGLFAPLRKKNCSTYFIFKTWKRNLFISYDLSRFIFVIYHLTSRRRSSFCPRSYRLALRNPLRWYRSQSMLRHNNRQLSSSTTPITHFSLLSAPFSFRLYLQWSSVNESSHSEKVAPYQQNWKKSNGKKKVEKNHACTSNGRQRATKLN